MNLIDQALTFYARHSIVMRSASLPTGGLSDKSVRPSVRPSHTGIESKQMNAAQCRFHHPGVRGHTSCDGFKQDYGASNQALKQVIY